METLGIISFITIAVIASFLVGLVAMAKYINSKPKQIEKPPTRNSIYADHVISTAAQIYCNYNESKIIRVGQGQEQQRKDRYSQSLNEAFNLVNWAYGVFDDLDNPKPPTKTPVNLNIN